MNDFDHADKRAAALIKIAETHGLFPLSDEVWAALLAAYRDGWRARSEKVPHLETVKGRFGVVVTHFESNDLCAQLGGACLTDAPSEKGE